MRIQDFDPLVLAVHLACPRLEYTDQGKGHIELPKEIVDALDQCIQSVAKPWKQAKNRTDRMGRIKEAELERLRKAKLSQYMNIKDAAYHVMEWAYQHAAGDTGMAEARQVMYAARRRILELNLTEDGRCWKKSSYFTQKLLPNFIEEHPKLTANWDVIFGARGRLIEPHTGRHVDLGTLAVRNYIDDWSDTIGGNVHLGIIEHSCPTSGPDHRYRFALFIEKEGFHPLLEKARIQELYDVAIMSTKGLSVTASRQLVERLSERGVTVIVIRDFDKAGFTNVYGLSNSTRRYRFRTPPKLIDGGLRLQYALAIGLQAERVEYECNVDPRENLRRSGATEEECNFLVQRRTAAGWVGERIELNAMTAPQFIDFVIHTLREAGVVKVVPEGEALQQAYERAVRLADVQAAINKTLKKASGEGQIPVPEGLAELVRGRIKDKPISWDDAVWEIANEQASGRRPRKESA